MLAPLLTGAGFTNSVVDVDRAQVSYRSLGALVADLRKMGATNVLASRLRIPVTKSAFASAERHFVDAGKDGRTVETFEILHFAAWTPATS
jgi:hypothetical protein